MRVREIEIRLFGLSSIERSNCTARKVVKPRFRVSILFWNGRDYIRSRRVGEDRFCLIDQRSLEACKG